MEKQGRMPLGEASQNARTPSKEDGSPSKRQRTMNAIAGFPFESSGTSPEDKSSAIHAFRSLTPLDLRIDRTNNQITNATMEATLTRIVQAQVGIATAGLVSRIQNLETENDSQKLELGDQKLKLGELGQELEYLKPAKENCMDVHVRMFAQIQARRRNTSGRSDTVDAGNEAARGANIELSSFTLTERGLISRHLDDFEFLYGITVAQWSSETNNDAYRKIKPSLNTRGNVQNAILEGRVEPAHHADAKKLVEYCDKIAKNVGKASDSNIRDWNEKVAKDLRKLIIRRHKASDSKHGRGKSG